MRFYKKEKKSINGKRVFSLSVLGIRVFNVEKSFFEKKISLCGFSFKYHRNKIPSGSIEVLFEDCADFLSYLRDKKKTDSEQENSILWFDASIGGGTDVYSRNQFDILQKKYRILRAQYNHVYDCFRISVPDCAECYVYSSKVFFDFLLNLVFSVVCVNSLVGWKDCLSVLEFASSYKKIHSDIRVSFRCHDYYAICPSFNLINRDGEYCRLDYKSGCQNCIRELIDCSTADNAFSFCCKGVLDKWRQMWGEFFYHTADELIAFSPSTKSIFLEVYPEILNKIEVIPHTVKKLDKAVIGEHSGVNIAFLGNMNLYPKGSDLIREMIKNNSDPDIHFFVIGAFDNAPDDVVVTGEYRSENIPEIFSKYSIDIVFITSIWPETFSYTTSEAISTGVAVACFDFGAPAERVAVYEKGLILKEISPRDNLAEIKKFVSKSK